MLTLDLDKLTPEKVREALPNMGRCRYAAPCIIGTLIPREKREFFDTIPDRHDRVDSWTVEQLHQMATASELQELFDNSDEETFLAALEHHTGIKL